MRRFLYAMVLILLLGVAAWRLRAVPPLRPKSTTPHEAFSGHPPPPASAPLLVREAWLMRWQPAWYREEWQQRGRPPILWSPQDGAYYVKGVSVLLTLPSSAPWQSSLSLPGWVGRPLQP